MYTKQVAIVSLVLFNGLLQAAEPVAPQAGATRPVEIAASIPKSHILWVKISEHITGQHNDPIIWQGRVPSVSAGAARIDLPISNHSIRLSFFVNPPIDSATHKAFLTEQAFVGRAVIDPQEIGRLDFLRFHVIDIGTQHEKLYYRLYLHFSNGQGIDMAVQK